MGLFMGQCEGHQHLGYSNGIRNTTKTCSAPFGLDVRDPKFWGQGLSMISAMIDELDAMEDSGS